MRSFPKKNQLAKGRKKKTLRLSNNADNSLHLSVFTALPLKHKQIAKRLKSTKRESFLVLCEREEIQRTLNSS